MNKKIKSNEEMKKIVEGFKRQNKIVVTTNGCYDILHLAHINLLNKLKSLGDVLIILLNSDSSIRSYKGQNRPIIPEQERAEMLAALESVDYVTLFNENKPLKILQELKPNIHTKGKQGESSRNEEERKLVESWGGQLKEVDSGSFNSTTDIIKKILEAHKNE